ncbi:MAG: hypothetical protein FWF67_01810 [Fibromonadales bacterium]|nr:hypothetical protein [Fibromonadales bacterium]
MAMTMEPAALEPKIKAAMESIENIGLGERANDLLDMLDEIALDVMLKESEEQDEKGLNVSAKELKKQIETEMRNGTYG